MSKKKELFFKEGKSSVLKNALRGAFSAFHSKAPGFCIVATLEITYTSQRTLSYTAYAARRVLAATRAYVTSI